ncbi:MAG: hypothetical protein LBU82_02775 [Treponema sp.]|jgi:hypothetical protein|nr:hypothetical protein [Treponema sp.]
MMMKYVHLVLLNVFILFSSCSTGEASAAAAAKILGGSSQAPVFLNCKAVSEDELEFEFSRLVKVVSLNLDPHLAVASIENGETVKVKFEKNPGPGMPFTADLVAEDEDGNTINVLIPFKTRNPRMPKLVINELCTEYSKPRTEFIEFKMKTAGNLGGMRVFFAGNSKLDFYEFQPVEVKAGDYVVLHLRTVEEGCKDETSAKLNASGGKNSSPEARDFWIPGNAKKLHKANSIVYVLDQDDKVLASIMVAEKSDLPWGKEHLAEAANFLFTQNAWKSSDGKTCRPADAVSSAGTTATRTICRNEKAANTNAAADWYITVSSGLTPGKPNNEKRYQKSPN